MNRKKLVALIMVLALAFTTLVGGTLAYFTDTDDATNTFTTGSVKITLNEKQRVEKTATDGSDYTDNNLVAFDETVAHNLMPLGTATNKYLDVNYVDKIVTVTNDSTYGKSPAYIRTIYAIPVVRGYDEKPIQSDNWLHWNVFSAEDVNVDKTEGWYWGTEATGDYPDDVNDWNSIKGADGKPEIFKIDGKEYMVYIATNVSEIKPGEETTVALRGLFLDSKVDCEFVEVEGTSSNSTEKQLNYYIMLNGQKVNLGDISNLKIMVYAQAVQSEGFADAWEAFEKSGLPNMPWAVDENAR